MAARSLDRILQSQGFGTRKACAALIRSGRVAVDGATIRKPGSVFEPEGLVVWVDDIEWRCARHCYLALHKPGGFECSRRPTHHSSVMELLAEHLVQRGVQPVGRLDQDSTGLLLLTDDGSFNHALTSPRRHVPKRYRVTTVDPVDDMLVTALTTGVTLRGETSPTRADECLRTGERELEMTILEGKYHQIKRMLAAAGNRCHALHRLSIGDLALADLALEPGESCRLTDDQLALFGAVWNRGVP